MNVKISKRTKRINSERLITENWQLLKCVPIEGIAEWSENMAFENAMLDRFELVRAYLNELSKEVKL